MRPGIAFVDFIFTFFILVTMLPVIPAIIAAGATAALGVKKAQKKLNQKKLIEESQNLSSWLTKDGFALNPDGTIQPNAKLDDGTPCHIYAVKSSKLAQTQCLLTLGADPNAMDSQGNTAIFYANDIDILKCLIEHGALINPQNVYGKTPLFTNESIEIVEHLLNNGADPNIQDGHGNTPLHDADSHKKIELLLNNGADPNIKDNQGNTPLHTADSHEKIELLLNNGADPNIKDNQGKTLLHTVQSYNILELLLENGADPNIRDNKGKSPLFYTTTLPMACALFRAGAQTDITAPVINQLKKYAPFIEYCDNTQNAPLYQAVLMNDLCLARIRLENAANPNTVFHDSSFLNNCSIDMLRLLCSFRANPNQTNDNGNSQLFEAIVRNNPDACEILIQYGAELCPDYLEKAIDMHHIECCERLLKHGLNVDEHSWNKAVEMCHPYIIELLEKYSDFELSYMDAPTLELKRRAANKHDLFLFLKNKQYLLKVMYNDPILSNNLYNAVNRCDIEAVKIFLHQGAEVTQQIIDIAYTKNLPQLLKILEAHSQTISDNNISNYNLLIASPSAITSNIDISSLQIINDDEMNNENVTTQPGEHTNIAQF